MRTAVALLAGAIAVAGCGGGDNGADTPDAGPNGFHPPPLKAACPAPTVQADASIAAPTGQHLDRPCLVWDGTQAAVAYTESQAGGTYAVKLQRLTVAGQTTGDAVTLGASTSAHGPAIALATDGTADVACWEDGTSIACASAPAASGAQVAGATIAGASLPSLAYGAGGFVLAYASADGAKLQPLDTSAKVHGVAASIATVTPAALALVARSNGYATILESANALVMRRVDKDLVVVGGDIMLAASFTASTVAAAATGDEVIAVWGEQAQVSEVTVTADGTVRPSAAVAPENIYSQVGAAGAKESFATTWSSEAGHIGYRAVDGNGATMGTPQNALDVNWDDNGHAIAGVADGFLVVSTVNPSGDKLSLAHLTCP